MSTTIKDPKTVIAITEDPKTNTVNITANAKKGETVSLCNSPKEMQQFGSLTHGKNVNIKVINGSLSLCNFNFE